MINLTLQNQDLLYDQLWIADEGALNGQIAVVDDNIFYNGALVGVWQVSEYQTSWQIALNTYANQKL